MPGIRVQVRKVTSLSPVILQQGHMFEESLHQIKSILIPAELIQLESLDSVKSYQEPIFTFTFSTHYTLELARFLSGMCPNIKFHLPSIPAKQNYPRILIK